MPITFYDLLGIDPQAGGRDATASLLFPSGLVTMIEGNSAPIDDRPAIVQLLQAGLTFKNVRPGVNAGADVGTGNPGQISFAADVATTAPLSAPSAMFYLASLPHTGIQILATDESAPAQVFVSVDARGTEVIVDGLPVRIVLQANLLMPINEALNAQDVTSGLPLGVGSPDAVGYALKRAQRSEIDAMVRLHRHPDGEVTLEASVPISFGAMRFLGLPVKAMYDVQLVASPKHRELYEWAHNDIGAFPSNPRAKGGLAIRSIELDWSQPPLKELLEKLQPPADLDLSQSTVVAQDLELVLEDIVIPLAAPSLPFPSHGTVGIRRRISDRSDIPAAYDFTNVPLRFPLYRSRRIAGRGGTVHDIVVEKFFFRSGELGATDPPDAPQVQFKAALVSGLGGTQTMWTAGIDDEWTVAFGREWMSSTSPVSLPIAGSRVWLAELTIGASIQRFMMHPRPPLMDRLEVLANIVLEAKGHDGNDDAHFKLESVAKPSEALTTVLRDIGWKLGHFSHESVELPDGVKLVIFDKLALIVDEMGWVEEANGTPYFSFSGGVEQNVGSSNAAKPSDTGHGEKKAYAISVDRLRFRLNDDASQPLFKLDGLTLHLEGEKFLVDGFGYVTDYAEGDWFVREWGFGAHVELTINKNTWKLAAEFVHGNRRNAHTGQRFAYFLAQLEVGYLPGGEYEFLDVRVLCAKNMAPNLDAQYPDGEGMVLLKWYKEHGSALDLPRNRELDAWTPEESAFAIGGGFRMTLACAKKMLQLGTFVFVTESEADSGILVVAELLLLKNPKPVAFLAIEYDWSSQKWGVMAGVDFALADFLDSNLSVPNWLKNVATMTGTVYGGNQPGTVAIGQLGDESSWLTLNISYLGLKMRFALCVQVVDGGPKGFGFLFEIRYGADRGWGTFLLFGSFGFIAGTFKSGSHASGLEFWASFGFRARLFRIFSFGIEIDLQFTYLKNHWSGTVHGELRIKTPRHLPKVTVTFDHTFSSPHPFEMGMLLQLLSGASGIEPATKREQPLLLPGLGNALGDASTLYTFNQLQGMNGLRITDTHLQDVPIVSTDATISIRFSQPVCNDALVGETTFNGSSEPGVQRVQDITVRYGLASVAIRRAPRFGPAAGVWSDLLTNAESAFSAGGGAPQTITFAWDHDVRADGRVSPVSLLMNSSAPYSFVTSSPLDDEQSVRADRDFPCCDATFDRVQGQPSRHVLDFSSLHSGARAPRGKQFSGERGAWWRWALTPSPVVAQLAAAPFVMISLRVALPLLQLPAIVVPAGPSSVTIGYADLEEPAVDASIALSWDPYPAIVYFEGYSGLDLAAQQSADLRQHGEVTLQLTVGPSAPGFTRLVLRAEYAAFSTTPPPPQIIPGTTLTTPVPWPPDTSRSRLNVQRATYLTAADSVRYLATMRRCSNGSAVAPPRSDGHGKLAFLPNHDYEVVVTGTASVGTRAQGTRTTSLSEALYFRTKGLPGLNACANTGDDIRLHVDSTYAPRRDVPLYRAEPCALAFENSLSSVLPIDRAPAAGDPPERAQMFELALNVDRVVSMNAGMKRLTVPSNDWISQHRAQPPAATYALAGSGITSSLVRLAPASDPQVLRFEALKAGRPACGPQNTDHPSQVLMHEPIDGAGTVGTWEASTGYRATVREKDGPYTERSGFDADDLATFTIASDGGASGPWTVDASRNAVAPAPGGGRSYAALGEPGWDHLQVHASVDLRTASSAGIAVGTVLGGSGVVTQAMIATVESTGSGNHALVLRQRIANADHELSRADVTLSGPALLSVIAFDDVVRATVGDVTVEGTRGAVREGRVALAADGPAAFGGVAVDALDIFAFEFVSSKYGSFGEHLDSYGGTMATLASGAFGGAAVTGASVLAAHGAQFAPMMQRSADPQARQRLFDAVVASLGIGLQNHPIAVGISRLTDTGGTIGLLVESPEPISLTRDVTIALAQHVGTVDVAIPLTALSNGDETRILLLSPAGAPLPPGAYALHAVLDRDRWPASGAPVPMQHYHQERTIALQW